MKDILLILLLQLSYVPVLTLRTIFLVKGLSVSAALFGFLEAIIYVFGLSLVFSGDQSTVSMVVYAVGFGIGILIGSYVENRLAIGYTTLVVNLTNKNKLLINRLREEGFGVTVFQGEGRDSERYHLDILTKRNREPELMDLIEQYEPSAFIISYEARKFKGGFLLKAMKKAKAKHKKSNVL
ncbi:DUF2179 domain-containing protein [Bacillus sp. AFS041924]|uniref:DUF2179 domain-containing protein n=1 Tax=Bacillus sp. AFS041924 TaxID=2033503 RepID=UPI000BFB3F07|nr:DUF2179 domain-containing protein [Bacillus sp. AFS041924]PGS55931.1 hypothetical protein COC46_02950 [Bacillus sp. AFS041924]